MSKWPCQPRRNEEKVVRPQDGKYFTLGCASTLQWVSGLQRMSAPTLYKSSVDDPFGDHQVGCGGNSDQIHQHDALWDVLFPVEAVNQFTLGLNRTHDYSSRHNVKLNISPGRNNWSYNLTPQDKISEPPSDIISIPPQGCILINWNSPFNST